jgi:hypothetical protein
MIGGMNLLGKGDGTEEAGYIGEFLLLRLLRKYEVPHVGLAFAGKSAFQIGLGHLAHITPPWQKFGA